MGSVGNQKKRKNHMNRKVRLLFYLLLVNSATLPLFSLLLCWVFRIIYFDLCRLPIGLGGGLFYLFTMPWFLFLSIPVAIVEYCVLRHSEQKVFRFVKITFILFAIMVAYHAFFFPVEKKPYHVGGYWLDKYSKN
jgi:hypothetical protein